MKLHIPRKRVCWLGGIALALVAVLAGGAAWTASRFQMAVKTSNAFRNTRDMPSPLVGQLAPDFTLLTPSGEKTSLSQFRGKPVLLTFWSGF